MSASDTASRQKIFVCQPPKGATAARIAASVRSTFPQALIASLMVHAGKVHGGALIECMKQLGSWLAAPSRDDFAEDLLEVR